MDVECAFEVVVTDVETDAFDVVITKVEDDAFDVVISGGGGGSSENKAGVLIDTVSGSIASFTPDATIPTVKGLTVDIEPVQSGSGDPSPDNIRPISGWDSVDVQRTAINVWDEEWEVGALSTVDGMPQVSTVTIRSKNYSHCVSGASYYVKCANYTDRYTLCVYWYDADKVFVSKGYACAMVTTSPVNAKYFKLVTNSSGTVYGTAYNNDISINYPSTDTAYHSGKDNTTYTIPLGQTVYGGTLDVINGVLTVDMAMVDMGTMNWSYSSGSSFNMRSSTNIGALPPEKTSSVPNAISSIYPVLSYLNVSSTDKSLTIVFATSGQAGSVWVHDSSYSDANTFKTAMSGAQLVYELATPITVDLTPIEVAVLIGQTNIIWADSGDVSVDYAADLKTYIDNKIAAAVAALS